MDRREERIQQLLTALAYASVDRFTEAMRVVRVCEEDQLGELEYHFRTFLAELDRTRKAEAAARATTDAARRELEERLAFIEAQRETISALSTPILDLWEGVLALPIIGVVDAARARDLTDRLLKRIVASEASAVIVDLSSVELVDSSTAGHLVDLTRAAALLGVECLLTGIEPKVARALVAIGVDFGVMKTRRTLREGLRAVLEALDPEPVVEDTPDLEAESTLGAST